MADARVLPSQVRAARAFLGWTISELSATSGVSVRTIKYLEAEGPSKQIKDVTLEKITATLMDAGIEFIGTPDDAPGIRFHGAPGDTKSDQDERHKA